MLPINHLKKTLDRECGPECWEFYNLPSSDTFRFKLPKSDLHYIAEYVDRRWHVSLWVSAKAEWLFDKDWSELLNSGKPTPLVTTDLLTGKKGLLSFATQELKDDFLRHAAPVMDTPDKEAQ